MMQSDGFKDKALSHLGERILNQMAEGYKGKLRLCIGRNCFTDELPYWKPKRSAPDSDLLVSLSASGLAGTPASCSASRYAFNASVVKSRFA